MLHIHAVGLTSSSSDTEAQQSFRTVTQHFAIAVSCLQRRFELQTSEEQLCFSDVGQLLRLQDHVGL